jgi:hypothetical protein
MDKRQRCCNCKYFKPDYGMWTATGWTGDGTSGECQLYPVTVKKRSDDHCSQFEPRNGTAANA